MTEPGRELTIRAVLLGVGLSALLGAANAYLGLFAGMTVSASIPAAVLSMAALRVVRGGILENNLVQTAASAGESAAAGAIFTLPALVLLGHSVRFDYWECTGLILVGGVLGVLFTIPLRRALLEERQLRFPEGVATAQVLLVGHGRDATGKLSTEPGSGVGPLAAGAGFGAVAKLFESGLGLSQGVLEGAVWLRGGAFYLGTSLSPALAAVGAIVGLPVALLMATGGLVNWLGVVPWSTETTAGSALDAAWYTWSAKTRYLGVGAMSVGGLWTLVELRGPLARALRRGRQALSSDAEQDDLSRRTLLLLIALVSALTYGLLFRLTWSYLISAVLLVVVLVLGFLFCAVAAYMAGLVGSSNNPVSGVTIATILITSAFLLVLGLQRTALPGFTAGPAAAILVGTMVCTAAAIGGDNMQDLKAGSLLGASPRKQQILQLLGVSTAALVLAPILNLLLTAYGFGQPTPAHPTPLPAPQATLMASVADGVFGGGLPWPFVALGAGLSVATIALDQTLMRRRAAFRTPVLALAVGIYLPLSLTLPMVFGALVSLGARCSASARLLTAAGIITGEALLGILLAGLVGAGLGLGSIGWDTPVKSSVLGSVLFVLALLLLRGRPARD